MKSIDISIGYLKIIKINKIFNISTVLRLLHNRIRQVVIVAQSHKRVEARDGCGFDSHRMEWIIIFYYLNFLSLVLRYQNDNAMQMPQKFSGKWKECLNTRFPLPCYMRNIAWSWKKTNDRVGYFDCQPNSRYLRRYYELCLRNWLLVLRTRLHVVPLDVR